MNKNQLIKGFKIKNIKKRQIELSDNACVVGTMVDEHNKLWYFIEADGEIKLERAKNQRIKSIIKISNEIKLSAKGRKVAKIPNKKSPLEDAANKVNNGNAE